jgi:16S rRNA (cytosine967-C5)-methyltransferase
VVKAQLVAVQVLDKVYSGASLTAALRQALASTPNLSNQERAIIQDLCYGVLRYRGQLEVLLALLVAKPIKTLNLQRLLLVALYQLQYSKAAAYAIVSHAVTASDSFSHGTRGLVNALLRNFLRKRESLLQQVASTEVGQFSHPQWWIERIKHEYPEDFTKILMANNQYPPMTLRVNRRKATVEEYVNLLEQHGISATAPGNSAVILDKPVPIDRLPGFVQGLVSVQDISAQRAAHFLDLHPGQSVLDACAAPGGKSAHILESADVDLVSIDIDEKRLPRIEENLSRLGLNAKIIHADAVNTEAWAKGRVFDRILVDAPCSASGVVKRHPDIKWLRRESDIAQFAQKQSQILDALWRVLAAGGKLLYSTCSIFFEENQNQITKFLNRNRDASLIPIDNSAYATVQLLPDNNHDGFFYALLQKNR